MNHPAHIDSVETEQVLLPHNLELEQALLGAILVNNNAMDKVPFLKPEHFFEPVHGDIFAACGALIEKGQSADPVRLKTSFSHHEGLESVGGPSYLVRLAASAATIINAGDYGRDIYNFAVRRELIGIGMDLAYEAQNSEDEPDDLIDQAEGQICVLRESGFSDRPRAFSQSIASTLKQIEFAHSGVDLVGVTTGLGDLDLMLGGLRKGKFYIAAGRPGMGKSLLASNISKSAAKAGHRVLFFSLEMSKEEIALRIIADSLKDAGVEIDYSLADKGKLSAEQHKVLADHGHIIQNLPLDIYDRAAVSLSQVRSWCRIWKRKYGLDLVIIDYLQLMKAGATYRGQRVQEVSELTAGLKALAKDMDVPVLGFSQLSRQVEHRDNKRPMLSDLRESGSLEQDADVVLFLYREAYYLEKNEPKDGGKYAEWMVEMTACRNLLEIDIAKQRQGPTGMRKFYVGVTTASIRDLARG